MGSLPRDCPRDRVAPSRDEMLDLVGALRRDVCGRRTAQRLELRRVLPNAGGEAREVGRSERRRLRGSRALDRDAEHVGLELHQEVVEARTAVDVEAGQAHLGIVLHGGEDVVHLERQPLERRADDVRLGGAARDAVDGAARILVPVRRAEPREGRHHAHAAGILHRARYLRRAPRVLDQAEVDEPADELAAHERASLERVDRVAVGARRDRGEQASARQARFVADVHEEEAAGAVRALGLAGREATLAEQRRLLVARNAGDRDARVLPIEDERAEVAR